MSGKRPIEPPLLMIRDHPRVRYLSASAYGCLIRILTAHVLGEIDLDQMPETRLRELARCAPAAWMAMKGEVREALDATKDIVVSEYRRKVESSIVRWGLSSQGGKKAAITKRQNKAQTELVSLADKPSPSMLPIKAQNFTQPVDFVRKSWSDQAQLKRLKLQSKTQGIIPTLTDKK